MPSLPRSLAGCCVVLIATASELLAQERANQARAMSSHHAGPVMPSNAILVLDPGVDAKGEPQPILRDSLDGGLEVEIPPTIHVHRYYPSGPREFQAQYFAGGPTIVTVRHPYSNERVNVHLDLAAGYPRIKYDLDEIQYKYPEESFSIHFGRCGGVTKSYSRCGVVKVKCQQKAEKVKECSRDLGDRLGINKFADDLCKEGKDLAAGAKDRTGQFVSKSGELFIGALNIVPGYQLLKSNAEDEATKQRDLAVQRVATERARGEDDIKTLR